MLLLVSVTAVLSFVIALATVRGYREREHQSMREHLNRIWQNPE
ncbi:MAG TPA: hypothetical protein VNH18_28870 [Bryobacteraceae bacterium]|nr:hypothetical protein [Bryobacteraceae bacterium]